MALTTDWWAPSNGADIAQDALITFLSESIDTAIANDEPYEALAHLETFKACMEHGMFYVACVSRFAQWRDALIAQLSGLSDPPAYLENDVAELNALHDAVVDEGLMDNGYCGDAQCRYCPPRTIA